MMFTVPRLGLALLLLWIAAGCQTSDPARHFITKTDGLPESSRPIGWENVKQLMARPAPKVGQHAPDFTLPTLDGSEIVTRSVYQQGRPLFLIFGSFT